MEERSDQGKGEEKKQKKIEWKNVGIKERVKRRTRKRLNGRRKKPRKG